MYRIPLARHLVPLLFLGAAAAGGHDHPPPDSAFLGTWRITGGTPGQIDDAAPSPPRPDLVGATVSFTGHAVEAPHPLGCNDARYQIQALPADMLFQGTLGDAAVARAHALELSATATPTLMVQCDGGLFDYHLTEAHGATAPHLLIMLDRVIYTLERTEMPSAP